SGSEPLGGSTTSCPSFLSCLSGSEHQNCPGLRGHEFLSCLSGSEPEKQFKLSDSNFLSCLSGSELDHFTLVCLASLAVGQFGFENLSLLLCCN
ncbi:hypothetical protein, partial [Aquitalea pelogenes]|uniref:hypothetical protein n=1 Tax=Aquitalea pelogenes TaxID=1293573 RepID=UPI0007881F69